MMADNFYRRNWNIFFPEISWNGPEPGYNGREFQTVTYIAALLYVLLGQHDWIGRSIGVMFGLWGIFALYQLVRRVWDEEHAIISAAVMALLPGSIFFDRSFLPDPAMVSLVVTCFWVLVVYFQTERLRYLLLAGVIGMLGFLTKITGLIVGIPMIYTLVTILGRKRLLKPMKFATIGVVAVLMLVPLVLYYLWARHLALTYPPYHFAGAGNWVWDDGLQRWLSKNYFLPQLYWNFNTWLWTKPVIALFCVGLILKPPGTDLIHKHENLSIDKSGKAPWLFHWWMLAGVIYYLIGAKELVSNSWNFHILNPAAAALVGHAILVIASLTSKFVRSVSAHAVQLPAFLATVAVLLLIIGGFGYKGLRQMYNPQKPWNATESYKMGLALRQISKPSDLVVTIANDIGSPVAIYYSQRRGWVFPPAFSELDWTELPGNDDDAIRLLEKLRASSADWLGIVNEHVDELWKNYPNFVEYIERTCEFHSKSKDWIIYRIRTLEEVSKLPA